jgi:hypothetical protein
MVRSAIAGLVLLAAVSPLEAQPLRERCTEQVAVAQCQRSADMAVSLPARLTIMAAGGSPTPGMASTLGMRMPGSPRFSAAVRGTMARVRMPAADLGTATGTTAFTGGSVALDMGIGVFNGVALAPTVGGFGSLDILASAGLVRVPDDDDLHTSSSFTWAAGARVGVLRESFTAPGVSLSAMYRALPDVAQRTAAGNEPFGVTDQGVVSIRGMAGKRILGVGLAGGVGYDRTTSDVAVTTLVPGPIGGTFTLHERVTDARLAYFGSGTYTTSIVNLVVELGWQQDGDRAAGAHGSTRRGGVFGGAAIRLTL